MTQEPFKYLVMEDELDYKSASRPQYRVESRGDSQLDSWLITAVVSFVAVTLMLMVTLLAFRLKSGGIDPRELLD